MKYFLTQSFFHSIKEPLHVRQQYDVNIMVVHTIILIMDMKIKYCQLVYFYSNVRISFGNQSVISNHITNRIELECSSS